MRNLMTIVMLGLLLASCANSSPEISTLAEKTAANVGVIGAQLTRLGRNSREVAILRAENISRLHGANARLRAEYEIDVELTKKSGGVQNLALIAQIKAWRDKVQTILDTADDAETKFKVKILASQTSLDTRKKELAGIAQGLAELSKKDTPKERGKFLMGFVKELKKEMDKALEADSKSAKAAKALLAKAKIDLGAAN